MAEYDGWALRLTINDTRQMVFEVRRPLDVLKALASRGIRTGYATKPIPWIKLN